MAIENSLFKRVAGGKSDLELYVAPDEIEGQAALSYAILLDSNRRIDLPFTKYGPRYRDLKTGRFLSAEQYEDIVGHKPLV